MRATEVAPSSRPAPFTVESDVGKAGVGISRRGPSAAGVLGVAIWMLSRMLGGHGGALFLGTRLNSPLGYVNGQAGYLLVAVWPCLAISERRGSRRAAMPAGAALGGMVILTGLGLLT